tara:strand:+ start:424 stop:861 length:438 start_codon:yes stop_codon:yes gene_type:complete
MNKVDNVKPADFSLYDINGNLINFQQLKGSYLLVNFWATWCKPCVNEIPSLNNLHKKLSINNNFQVIAINIGQDKTVVEKFLNDVPKIDFMILLDENMDLTEWSVQAIPTTFLVNNKGEVVYSVEGEKQWDSLEFISFINSEIKK